MAIRSARHVLAISSFALIAACSGGGGATGGGVSTIPPSTPTPTPTPAPTATNDDLVAPLVTESFSNDSAGGTASYTGSGFSTTVAPSTLTVRYDASNSSYTVTAGAASQTFLPANRDPSLSTGESDIFVRTSGNTTDSLSISKAGMGPGTRVSPVYRYVGGGVWQNTVQGSATVEGKAQAFAFGVETPDATLVRTGAGTYAVQLRGLAAYGDAVIGSRGTGEIKVNFASGAMTGQGQLTDYAPGGSAVGGARTWILGASLSSSRNGFSGAFGLSQPFGGGTTTQDGFVNGRFYGPNAEELGAVYGWRDSFLGLAYTGYILGKNASLFPENTTLAALSVEQVLPAYSYIYQYTFRKSDGEFFGIGEPNPHPDRTVGVRFDEAGQAIELNYSFEVNHQLMSAARRNAALSNATYDVYTYTDPATGSTPVTATVHMFKPVATNPELALTYVSFGYWLTEQNDTVGADYVKTSRAYFAYGLPTPASAVPTTGTASYNANLYGQSTFSASAGGGAPLWLDVTGTGHFDLDFGAATLTGYLRPVGRDSGGTVYTFTRADFAGTLASGGLFNAGGSGTTSGNLQGQLFGPTGQEIGGRFMLDSAPLDTPTNGFNAFKIFGVFVGKKGPTGP